MTLVRLTLPALAVALAVGGCVPASAPTAPASTATAPATAPNPTVGGATMRADRTIVANAAAAPNLTTLVAAVRAAGLAETLSGAGPFTVFAPTDEAFGRLAPGMLDTLLKPENKATLARVLTYHVVPGMITAADLRARIAAGGGSANLRTVAGDLLTARVEEGAVTLTDMNGTRTYVETPDVRQSNGVVHVVNGVLVPRLG